MSTNLPEQPETNEPDSPNTLEPEDATDDIADEEPLVNSGLMAFLVGVIGMLIGFCGAISGISGHLNILFDLGGVLMSLAAVFAIETLRCGGKRGRTESIFILVLMFLPLFSYWSSLLSRIFGIF